MERLAATSNGWNARSTRQLPVSSGFRAAQTAAFASATASPGSSRRHADCSVHGCVDISATPIRQALRFQSGAFRREAEAQCTAPPGLDQSALLDPPQEREATPAAVSVRGFPSRISNIVTLGQSCRRASRRMERLAQGRQFIVPLLTRSRARRNRATSCRAPIHRSECHKRKRVRGSRR